MTHMKSLLLFSLYLFFSLSATAADSVVADGGYSIASKFSLESHILGEAQEFYVSVPVSYEDSVTAYPVIIVLDGGQNIEHAVASARMLSQWKGLPETIVVAIPSMSRIRDFTPSLDANYAEESGGAENFNAFIKDEVMKFVDANFRTHPFRILTGHSLSGVFAADQFIKGNSYFNAYIIIAPSLWWNSHEIITKVNAESFVLEKKSTRVFLGIGELDGWGMKQELQQFKDGLGKGGLASDKLLHKEFPGEGHMSITLPSIYEGLQHVLGGSIYDRSRWDSFTPESFLEFTRNTQRVYGPGVAQTGELYVELAQFLIAKSDYEGAITVLKTNIDVYPAYPPNYALLAQAYALNEQTDLAVEQYKEAAKFALVSESFGEGFANGFLDIAKKLEAVVDVSEGELKSHVGCYAAESGSSFSFLLENGRLTGSRQDWTDFRLFATSSNQFFMITDPQLALTFDPNEVVIELQGATYSFSKQPCP